MPTGRRGGVMIPIEVIPYEDPTPIVRQAQLATKEDYPWWWNEHGCEGTWWPPELGEVCRDLT